MNRNILIIAGLLIANQSFADITATNGVANPATCDSGALDTDSGGAALEAEYSPETIDLRWYDNNTLMNVTSTNSDTCTYDAGMSLPSNPTKTGYTFKGWKVRPQYDFSTLAINTMGIAHYGKGHDISDYCGANDSAGRREGRTQICSENEFAELNPYEWKTVFSWGTLYGMSRCSATADTVMGVIGTPNESYGTYCWCKATGYVPTGENTKYSPTTQSNWIYSSNCIDNNSQDMCKLVCAIRCGAFTRESRSFGENFFQ